MFSDTNPFSHTLFLPHQNREFAECIKGLEDSIRYNKKALERREEINTSDIYLKSKKLMVIRDDIGNTLACGSEDSIKNGIEENAKALQTVKRMALGETISHEEYEHLLKIDRITRFDVIRNYRQLKFCSIN